MSVYYQAYRNLDFIIAFLNAIIALQKTTLKYVFGQAKKPIDICTKIVHMDTKIFNIIPGSGEVTILLYGDIGDGGKVESGRVVSELLALQRTYSRIDVRINSNGGDVFSGIAIYNALKTSSADITIYIDGVAASIAAIIALCGKPLYMSPYAKLMLHSVSGGTWGNSSVLRKTADTMDSLQADLSRMIAGRCNMKPEDVAAQYFDEHDHWIDASQALAMNLVDGIYEMEAPSSAPGTTEEIYNYFNNRLVEQPPKTKDMALIDDIRSIPAFSDKSDESAIVAHIKSLTNSATRADALERANEQYKARIAELEGKEISAIIDKAVAEGKITKEQTAVFTNMMKSDRANTEALLATMKAQPSLRASSFINTDGSASASFANKSWDDLDKEGNLEMLKTSDFALFCSKFRDKFGVDYKN